MNRLGLSIGFIGGFALSGKSPTKPPIYIQPRREFVIISGPHGGPLRDVFTEQSNVNVMVSVFVPP